METRTVTTKHGNYAQGFVNGKLIYSHKFNSPDAGRKLKSRWAKRLAKQIRNGRVI